MDENIQEPQLEEMASEKERLWKDLQAGMPAIWIVLALLFMLILNFFL